jgi:hypothetical protein
VAAKIAIVKERIEMLEERIEVLERRSEADRLIAKKTPRGATARRAETNT